MSEFGAPDPLYVAARRALLDAIEALEQHRDAIVLVGAQAVYLRAGAGDIAVAAYTTDGDIAIDPRGLAAEPLIETALAAAGFRLDDTQVGIWQVSMTVEGIARQIPIDLLVPETLAGAGRRGARIPPHSATAARKVSGLEGVLVDNDDQRVAALDPTDSRAFRVRVAGPAALLIAKTFKIQDRRGSQDRLRDKDALDVYRLLRAIATDELLRRVQGLLSSDLSRAPTELGLSGMRELFGRANAAGCRMMVRAAGPLENGESIAASAAALTVDLLGGL